MIVVPLFRVIDADKRDRPSAFPDRHKQVDDDVGSSA